MTYNFWLGQSMSFDMSPTKDYRDMGQLLPKSVFWGIRTCDLGVRRPNFEGLELATCRKVPLRYLLARSLYLE